MSISIAMMLGILKDIQLLSFAFRPEIQFGYMSDWMPHRRAAMSKTGTTRPDIVRFEAGIHTIRRSRSFCGLVPVRGAGMSTTESNSATQ
ncbi:hypothetical protein HK097_001911, partial [Rhizophlyctis rosea]